jgi:hypothetical protein
MLERRERPDEWTSECDSCGKPAPDQFISLCDACHKSFSEFQANKRKMLDVNKEASNADT